MLQEYQAYLRLWGLFGILWLRQADGEPAFYPLLYQALSCSLLAGPLCASWRASGVLGAWLHLLYQALVFLCWGGSGWGRWRNWKRHSPSLKNPRARRIKWSLESVSFLLLCFYLLNKPLWWLKFLFLWNRDGNTQFLSFFFLVVKRTISLRAVKNSVCCLETDNHEQNYKVGLFAKSSSNLSDPRDLRAHSPESYCPTCFKKFH